MTWMIFKRLSLINRPQRDLMQPWIDYSKDTIGLCNLWQISKKAFFKLLHTYEFNIKGLELKDSIRLFQEFLSGNQPTSSNVSIFEQLWHYRYVPRWGVSNEARHNWKYFLAYRIFEKNILRKKKKKSTSFHATF